MKIFLAILLILLSFPSFSSGLFFKDGNVFFLDKQVGSGFALQQHKDRVLISLDNSTYFSAVKNNKASLFYFNGEEIIDTGIDSPIGVTKVESDIFFYGKSNSKWSLFKLIDNGDVEQVSTFDGSPVLDKASGTIIETDGTLLLVVEKGGVADIYKYDGSLLKIKENSKLKNTFQANNVVLANNQNGDLVEVKSRIEQRVFSSVRNQSPIAITDFGTLLLSENSGRKTLSLLDNNLQTTELATTVYSEYIGDKTHCYVNIDGTPFKFDGSLKKMNGISLVTSFFTDGSSRYIGIKKSNGLHGILAVTSRQELIESKYPIYNIYKDFDDEVVFEVESKDGNKIMLSIYHLLNDKLVLKRNLGSLF